MSKKVIIRPWKIDDLDALVILANNPAIAKYMTDQFPSPYTEEAGIKFINYAMSGDPLNIFAIEADGALAGGIGLHSQPDIYRLNMELGYWIGESYWGQGIVTDAIEQIVEYGFKTFEVQRIFARPFGTNISSQKVLEKTGFILEAKLEKTLVKNGEMLDEWIYARRKNTTE